MALVLMLQLLALSWPLCHTDVTSNGTQEAQGPGSSGPRASFPKQGRRMLGQGLLWLPDSTGAPPPRRSWPGPLPPGPALSRPKSPRALNPPFRFPYPKPWRPTDPVPPFPDPEPLPRPLGWPTYADPAPSRPRPPPPEPRRPMHWAPPTALPKPPKPSLAALPAAVVTPGNNVTLTCRAPLPASKFVLKSGEGSPVQYQYPDGSLAQAQFFLEAVTEAQGGSYRCEYHHRGWSHPSDALELMVTDLLPRPSLEALPGPRAPGAPVSLRCTGRARNMSFALYRAGEATPLQFRESEQPWADFPLPRAQAAGTYTCYYHTPAAPYVLSQRSEPLVVSLEGSGSVDYTKGNVVRLVLAGLVLISLATLVGWEWRGWRRASDRSPGGLQLDPMA